MDGSSEIIRTIAASQLSFKYEELCKATDDFNQINKLGQGGYGSVYKVQCHILYLNSETTLIQWSLLGSSWTVDQIVCMYVWNGDDQIRCSDVQQ